jgi:hypothetical protein
MMPRRGVLQLRKDRAVSKIDTMTDTDVERMLAEIERLRAIVARLPHTDDRIQHPRSRAWAAKGPEVT